MPDRVPPTAPEGCVYGPWWDKDIRIGGCWCYSDGTLTYAWLPSFSTWVVTEAAALRELLRLAKENAELRAIQPSEEDRAVLWLMKEEGWKMQFSAQDGWHAISFEVWVRSNPVEEARKLGWGGGE